MTTQEGNKLIAEFMELKSYEDSRYGILWPDPLGSNTSQFSLKYHSSWDWLMPVVEKICQFHNGISYEFRQEVHDRLLKPIGFVHSARFSGDYRKTNDVWFNGQSFKSAIEATWQAVLEFIQWFNQNPQ